MQNHINTKKKEISKLCKNHRTTNSRGKQRITQPESSFYEQGKSNISSYFVKAEILLNSEKIKLRKLVYVRCDKNNIFHI